MSGQTRRFGLIGASRKRKELEGVPETTPVATEAEPALEPPNLAAGSRLVAGYLAHEFLTRGTLLGQRLDPARPIATGTGAVRPEAYADVARLVRAEGGAHIPGVVNPTQLGRWLQQM